MDNNELTKELIIASHPNEVQLALLENKKLVEIHRETSSDCHSVGDIYLGTVRKIMPGLNAAFVDVGSEKDAFLHYLDLGTNARTFNEFVNQAINFNKKSIAKAQKLEDVEKNGKIGNVLTSGQKILVQVAKEAISTKGPRVTTEISFAG
jgi:ribonuclease G